jgi:hypothetical protein
MATGTERWTASSLRAAIVLAAALGAAAEPAWALPSGFGAGCTTSAATGASLGSVLSPGFDTDALNGECGGGSIGSAGVATVAVVTDAGPNLFSFAQAADASVQARASLGSLGARATSTATSDPMNYLYTVNGQGAATDNQSSAFARSGANASWHDEITIGGTPSANGFVILRFTLDLHGTTFASGSAGASMESRLFLNDFSRIDGALLDLTVPGSATETFGFAVGQQVQLYGDIDIRTFASAGRVGTGYFAASDATVEAFDTAGFHIDVLSPGGSYTSLSGTNYATVVTAPVPEPATWMLLVAGMLMTGRLAHRRRS